MLVRLSKNSGPTDCQGLGTLFAPSLDVSRIQVFVYHLTCSFSCFTQDCFADDVSFLNFRINALYALYWDVVMDWGMMQNPSVVVQAACIGGKPPSADGQTPPGKCHHVLLRPRLRFGLAISSLIVFTDAILRFSWMLRFLPWFPNHDSYVLCTQFLEVFR